MTIPRSVGSSLQCTLQICTPFPRLDVLRTCLPPVALGGGYEVRSRNPCELFAQRFEVACQSLANRLWTWRLWGRTRIHSRIRCQLGNKSWTMLANRYFSGNSAVVNALKMADLITRFGKGMIGNGKWCLFNEAYRKGGDNDSVKQMQRASERPYLSPNRCFMWNGLVVRVTSRLCGQSGF